MNGVPYLERITVKFILSIIVFPTAVPLMMDISAKSIIKGRTSGTITVKSILSFRKLKNPMNIPLKAWLEN